MRMATMVLATAIAAAAAGLTTVAVGGERPKPCPGHREVARSSADALAHCGAKPSTAGPWRCVGEERAKETFNPHGPPKCDGFQSPMRWTWQGPSVEFQDSWKN